MQKIQPCLWFDANCEEAMNFYVATFPNSKVRHVQRYPEGATEGPMAGMSGKILTAIFELDGFVFQALDGGPMFKLNPSISFFVNFDPSRNPNAQADLDAMWEKLSEGGTALMPLQQYPFSKKYGWIQDRFGVSWQLILTDPEGEPRPDIIPSMLFVTATCTGAEEAMNFYRSVFKDSRPGTIARYPAEMEPNKEGSIMYSDFMLENQWFTAMDASASMHSFAFNEALSFSIETADQAETDYYWEKLVAGGSPSQCGWLKDRFGVSWQVIPTRLGELLSDPDAEKAGRATQAMLQMSKIDIAALEKAFDGR